MDDPGTQWLGPAPSTLAAFEDRWKSSEVVKAALVGLGLASEQAQQILSPVGPMLFELREYWANGDRYAMGPRTVSRDATQLLNALETTLGAWDADNYWINSIVKQPVAELPGSPDKIGDLANSDQTIKIIEAQKRYLRSAISRAKDVIEQTSGERFNPGPSADTTNYQVVAYLAEAIHLLSPGSVKPSRGTHFHDLAAAFLGFARGDSEPATDSSRTISKGFNFFISNINALEDGFDEMPEILLILSGTYHPLSRSIQS